MTSTDTLSQSVQRHGPDAHPGLLLLLRRSLPLFPLPCQEDLPQAEELCAEGQERHPGYQCKWLSTSQNRLCLVLDII